LNITSPDEYQYFDYEADAWTSATNQNETHFFKVSVEFDDSTFMEIQHVRAFNFESLIGNSGGYLGLFTGYALVQIPSLINFISKRLQNLSGAAS